MFLKATFPIFQFFVVNLVFYTYKNFTTPQSKLGFFQLPILVTLDVLFYSYGIQTLSN